MDGQETIAIMAAIIYGQALAAAKPMTADDAAEHAGELYVAVAGTSRATVYRANGGPV